MIKVNLNYIKDVETMRFCDFEKVAKFIHHDPIRTDGSYSIYASDNFLEMKPIFEAKR